MKILLLGDVMGRVGREAVLKYVPELRVTLKLDFVVVNGENASHGFGLAPDMADAFFAAGADVVTLGNHAWDRREIIPYIATQNRLLRPLNYPPGTPGQGAVLVPLADGRKVLVAQAIGRLFMDPLDCPFRAVDDLLARHKLGVTTHAIVLDIHAEASSEKMAFAHAFDGRVSCVTGTHTHIPTGDAQVLPLGTAYQTDLGMCGDYDSVIGMQKAPAMGKFIRKLPGDKLAPAEGPATLCGAVVETDDATGLAKSIQPLRLGGRLAYAMPAF
jgi:metallophosphoesterase (TIGR00282 family)